MNDPQTSFATQAAASLAAPSAVLTMLSERLDVLKAQVAKEFMALAALLQSNSLEARKITSASHQATGSETSQRGSHSIAVLQGVLTDSAGITEMVATSTRKMSEILAHVKAVGAPLRRLTKMSTLLRIVSVLARIEGGRIDSDLVDISGLSQDIDRLAAEVEQHIDQMVEDASILSGLLQKGVGGLHRFGERERTDADDLIRRTQALLGPAMTCAEASQAAARTIDEQYKVFHRATDKVVMSLQSEDLARQRLEHVQEALRRSADRMDLGDSAASCASILVLQRAQLAGTRDLLAHSVQAIQSGLESLGPRILDLVSKTATLARQTDEDGRSFAILIDGGLDTVANVFRQCSSSASAVFSIVNSVLPSVEKMTGRACALEAIEVSIRLISLNATVKTSQLGSEGAAMGVLAAELQSITIERGGDTSQVLTGLTAIREALARITQGRTMTQGSSMMVAGSADLVSGELAGLSNAVTSASHETALRLDEVRRLAEGLCSELTRGVELAVRAASLTQLFDDLLIDFDRAFEQLGLTSDMTATTPGAHQTEHISSLYSMESERVLHLQVFGSEAGSADSPASPSTGSASAAGDVSEFGDDVELF